MSESAHRAVQEAVCHSAGGKLDLVVPFTTPSLTTAALSAAGMYGSGLRAHVRLLKIQLVPWPLDLSRSPVPLAFLADQLRSFFCALPLRCEVRLARDFTQGLMSALDRRSVVLLAAPARPWKTRNEVLAARLRTAGYSAVLVPAKENVYA